MKVQIKTEKQLYSQRKISTESRKNHQDNKTGEPTRLPRPQIIRPDEQYTLQNLYKSTENILSLNS